MEKVVLVDENDQEIGSMDKLEAHVQGVLHRAFSILIFNSDGEMLIQKRASSKYHSGGLWTNACCSHPSPGETMESATRRRLFYEMGIDAPMTFVYKFIYKTELDRNLTEHEYDHVFVGTYDGEPKVNPEEVEDWRYISLPELRREVAAHPEQFTYWFRMILNDAAIEQFA